MNGGVIEIWESFSFPFIMFEYHSQFMEYSIFHKMKNEFLKINSNLESGNMINQARIPSSVLHPPFFIVITIKRSESNLSAI